MIQRIVSFALAQPLFTLLLAVLFVAGGLVAFRQLPIEAFPDVSDEETSTHDSRYRSFFSQPIRDNILESISQIDGQIVVKVFGPDGDVLHEKAGHIVAAISGIRGVSRAFIDRAGRIPQLQIEINRERAARYGLNITDIQDVIETAIGGKVETEIWAAL